MTKHMEC